MRLWVGTAISLGALAVLAYACIPVPDRIQDSDDAPDGADVDPDAVDAMDADDPDGTDVVPEDAGTDGSGACASTMGGQSALFRQVSSTAVAVSPGVPTIVAFTGAGFDENDDFCEDRTFVAPTLGAPERGEYLVCAGISGEAGVDLELAVATPTYRQLVAHGPSAISGCTALSLSDAETVQIEVTNRSGTGVMIGGDPQAGWIAISTIQNNGDWGTAEGLFSTVSNSAPVKLVSSDRNWDSSADIFPVSSTLTKPHLMCASLDYETNLGMEMGIDTADPDSLYLADAIDGVSTGCRIEDASPGSELSLRVIANGSSPTGPVPERNWVAVHRLQRNTVADWQRVSGGAGAMLGIGPGASVTIPFQSLAGHPDPQGSVSGQFGPVNMGGALVTCVSLRVPTGFDMQLAVVHSGARTQLARGDGRLHGCLPTGLGNGESLRVELKNMATAGPARDIPADSAARWYLVTLH